MEETSKRVLARIEEGWKKAPLKVSEGPPGEIECEVPADGVADFASFVVKALHGRLVSVVGQEEPAPVLRYLFSLPAERMFVRVAVRLEPGHRRFPSLTPTVHAAHWYERELHDLFGYEPVGHPHRDRLILHSDWPEGTHPFRKSFNLTHPVPRSEAGEESPAPGRDGEFELPFGPIRAGVVESAHFRFLTVGEEILKLEMQLFYKFRGIERLFENQPLMLCPLVAERVSGISSFAHSLAFCQAVERAAGIVVPRPACLLRTIYAELERIYNHLGSLAHLCEATSLRVGEAQCSLLKEYDKQLNAKLSGHRFLRGINAIGGVRRGLTAGQHGELLRAIDYIGRETKVLTDLILSTKSHLDRLVTTGILPEKLAADYGAVGPVARGSGLPWDMRKDHPYAAYGDLTFDVPVYHYGDALARMRVRMDEIPESINLIREAMDRFELAEGDLVAPIPQIPAGRRAIGWAESPRGGLVVFVETGEGNTLRRCKVRSPSFCNWYLFQATVTRTMMMDWPINERSFGLTHAGCDL